jgi:response regulator RpfG family c-di-GMP phosphodiesterase
MLRRILCVDDDERLLQGLERQLRKQFEIHTAVGPELGLTAISENGPFAVVVSDMRMPGMDGIEFLSRVREKSPDSIRMMLTGNADLNATIRAVNEGKIFQFLTKPCPSELLARALESSLEQHRLVTSERELLERTLRGSIGVLSEILSLVNPAAFSRAHRIRRYVQRVAEHLNLANRWEFELAAMLSQIGCVVIPPEIMDKYYLRKFLNSAELEILSSHCQVGHDLLRKIPRLENVAAMVREQKSGWSGAPDLTDGVKLGANLLRVATDFDERLMNGESPEGALAHMQGRKEYNPAFLAAVRQVQIEKLTSETRQVRVAGLKVQMIINGDVYAKSGLFLLAKGQEVTDSLIARLNGFAKTVGVVEPINVLVTGANTPTPSEEELDGLYTAFGEQLRPHV